MQWLALGALGGLLAASAVAKKPKPKPAGEEVETAIHAKDLIQTIHDLTGEEMGNRSPGTSGEEQARTYIAKQMSEMKLQPAGAPGASPAPPAEAADAKKPDGAATAPAASEAKDPAAFLQPLQLTLLRPRILPGGVPSFQSFAATVPIKISVPQGEGAIFAGDAKPSIVAKDVEITFVGYGLKAPEYQWDDYKDSDVSGKILLILDGDPQSDAKAFAGKARTHHARWPNKFVLAANQGALGAFIILDGKDSAAAGLNLSQINSSYGNGSTYVFDRGPVTGDAALKLRGFIGEETTKRIFDSARVEMDDLRKDAERRSFVPLRLKLKMSTSFGNEVRKVDGGNVVGVLPGTDPNLQKEAIVYTAHFDGQDALHSAGGVAALLAIARSAVKAGPGPRTLVFAALTAQTESLLGARHFLSHLPGPVTKVVAHINLDGINPLAPDPTVVQIGRGHSTIDAVLDAAAKEQERKVVAETNPELGLFYRSESLIFAEAGIPSLFLGWGDLARSMREDYHQAGKEGYGASWSFIGGAQDAELLLSVGQRISAAKLPPTFKKGDEFSSPKP